MYSMFKTRISYILILYSRNCMFLKYLVAFIFNQVLRDNLNKIKEIMRIFTVGVSETWHWYNATKLHIKKQRERESVCVCATYEIYILVACTRILWRLDRVLSFIIRNAIKLYFSFLKHACYGSDNKILLRILFLSYYARELDRCFRNKNH